MARAACSEALSGEVPLSGLVIILGDEVFARHVAAHDVKIPERSYLRAALQQREADIMASFHGAIAPELLAAE